MKASILLYARDGAAPLWAQVESLVAADLPPDVEVVIAADGADEATRALLARLEGDVTVRHTAAPVGRRAALALAAEAARAPVAIALAPTARPAPGFAAPLVAAVRAGAALAAPLLDTAGGPALGYRLHDGGGLLPVRPGEATEPDAFALDALAAPTAFFAGRLPAFTARDGLYEVAVADAARRLGPLATVPEALVARAATGPTATVCVATQNRAEELPGCIEHLAAHGALAAGGEVVVVDNASCDDTAAVLADLAARYPGLCLVTEPVPGLCRARNAAAAVARGDVLLYLDDDARPAPGWLEGIRDAFLRPAVVRAGGPIHGLFAPGRPLAWPAPEHEGLLSILDLGDADVEAPGTELYGANWAIRRFAWETAGGFDERVGPSAGRRIYADEVELGRRVEALGLGLARYVAAASVGHRIPADRVDDGYLLVRALRTGIEGIRLAQLHDGLAGAGLAARGVEAARHLAALATLPATCDADVALAAIATDARPFAHRMAAANALGVLAACAAALGAPACDLGTARIRITAAHAAGAVAQPRLPVAGSAGLAA